MARVDYYAIEQGIEEVLKDDPNLVDVAILIEPAALVERGNTVAIYPDRRSAPADDQVISAGRRTRLMLRFSIWCYSDGLERESVLKARDDFVGRVELALMDDPTLRGTVEESWLDGGEFDTPQELDSGFALGAEVGLVCRVDAVLP